MRRITGGGAIYLDPNQVGWELVLSRKRLPMPTLADYTRAICEAAAHGLSKAFGIDARYRPRNDIEVDGRKLCGTGGFFDGDTLIYQGTVLVDADPGLIMSCLNVPEAKLQKRDLDKAEQRVTTLKALLGGAPSVADVHAAILAGFAETLGIEPAEAMPSDEEEALAAQLLAEEIGTDEFVYSIDDPRGPGISEASLTGAGGTVTAYVRTEGPGRGQRVASILLTGDFFVTPPRIIYDLEASLRRIPLEQAGAAVDEFFTRTKPDLLTIAPAEFRRVIEDAICETAA